MMGLFTHPDLVHFIYHIHLSFHSPTLKTSWNPGNNADVFKKNVKALGLDLKTIDFAVLSHPHADHLSSFDYLVSVNPNGHWVLEG